jgi:hypothetical protein
MGDCGMWKMSEELSPERDMRKVKITLSHELTELMHAMRCSSRMTSYRNVIPPRRAEGLDETLTVTDLRLTPKLRQALATTNELNPASPS